MTEPHAAASVQLSARVAGAAYLLIIVIAMLNVTLVDSALIVPGDAAATARNIVSQGLLFRLGAVGILLMYASVVVLSVALYAVLKPVGRTLALLALLLRTGEAVLGAATVLLGQMALLLLDGTHAPGGIQADQAQALAGLLLDSRTAGLDLVLVFVGLGGTLFCYLFLVSKYVPRLLAAWGVITYASMLLLALVSMLLPDHPEMIEVVLYGFGTAFEVVFGLWLLLKGIDLPQWERRVAGVPAGLDGNQA